MNLKEQFLKKKQKQFFQVFIQYEQLFRQFSASQFLQILSCNIFPAEKSPTHNPKKRFFCRILYSMGPKYFWELGSHTYSTSAYPFSHSLPTITLKLTLKNSLTLTPSHYHSHTHLLRITQSNSLTIIFTHTHSHLHTPTLNHTH